MIYDKELLAIIEGLKEWRYLLIGTEEPVTIYTDHKNLQHFTESKQLNRRQARWSLFISDFNFILKYRPGHLQVVSDALSKRLTHVLNQEDERYNFQVLLPKALFVNSNHLVKVDRRVRLNISGDSVEVNMLESSEEDTRSVSNSDYDVNDYQSEVEDDSSDEELSGIGDVSHVEDN
jgi:hypothetical protein